MKIVLSYLADGGHHCRIDVAMLSVAKCTPQIVHDIIPGVQGTWRVESKDHNTKRLIKSSISKFESAAVCVESGRDFTMSHNNPLVPSVSGDLDHHAANLEGTAH